MEGKQLHQNILLKHDAAENAVLSTVNLKIPKPNVVVSHISIGFEMIRFIIAKTRYQGHSDQYRCPHKNVKTIDVLSSRGEQSVMMIYEVKASLIGIQMKGGPWSKAPCQPTGPFCVTFADFPTLKK